MSASSSRSGLARQTSMICAPFFTWRAGDLGGLFELLGGDQLLELAQPMTLVRSPTMTGRFSSVISR